MPSGVLLYIIDDDERLKKGHAEKNQLVISCTHNRLDSFLRRCVKLGFRHPITHHNYISSSTIAEDIQDTLLNKITPYHYHILQSYLPDRPDIDHDLRERHHN